MRGHHIRYSADELSWLEANQTMVVSEYHRAFCAQFGRDDISAANLHGLRKRKGWLTGRTGRFEKGAVPFNKGKPCPPGKGGRHPNARKTQFKKGQTPHNTNHLGHERVSKDGYVEISVDETNPHTGYERRYVLKHRWLWEQANGPVPEGMALKCLGDRLDTDPSNWELIPRALLPRLNGRFGRNYDSAPAELKPTILAVAKLEHAAREKSRSA
ncbi:MAG TPA: HNH endonuclease [Pseudorhizobium sp.]|jgi:hypothetical protein|nr:HNH endonuclease [Pseudorhizobium sp.]